MHRTPHTKFPSFGVDGNPLPLPSANPTNEAGKRVYEEEETESEEEMSSDNEGSEGKEEETESEEEMISDNEGSEGEEEDKVSEEEGGSGEDRDEHLDSAESTGLVPEMYFDQTQYEKKIKLPSRCHLKKAVRTLTEVLNGRELKWFRQHSQFKHFFHMRLETKHKVQGMWMLFLHGARTLKKREAWFVVNGVPIRYSIREHGILSGLYCHNYPLHWDRLGSLDFVRRHFKLGSTITYEVVEHKFLNMKSCSDRLNMVVLYFLSSVLIGKAKQGKKITGEGALSVEPFFLRAANDLELCCTFPWGRISFEDNLKQMSNLFEKFEGVVSRDQWVYSSFSIPLEILAFETISALKLKYRESNEGASANCPRMCTSRFQKHSVSGFAFDELYDALGTTKDIQSILVPTSGEQALCAEIFDEVVDDDRDVDDYIVESWKNRVFNDKKPVFLPLLHDIDVHAQRKQAPEKEAAEKEVAEQEGGEEEAANVEEEPQVVSNDGLEKLKKDMFDLKEGMLKMNQSMEDGFQSMMNLIGGQDKRLKEVESFVKSQTTYDSHFDHVSYSGGGGTTGGYGGTAAGDVGTTPGGGDAVETPTGGGDPVETPTAALETPTGGEEDSEEEAAEEGEEDSEKEAAEEDSEKEAAEEDEVVDEKRKRKRKPSDAKKDPYTIMTEEKKKKKAKSTKE